MINQSDIFSLKKPLMRNLTDSSEKEITEIDHQMFKITRHCDTVDWKKV